MKFPENAGYAIPKAPKGRATGVTSRRNQEVEPTLHNTWTLFPNVPPRRLVRRQQGVSQERNLAEIRHIEVTVFHVCFYCSIVRLQCLSDLVLHMSHVCYLFYPLRIEYNLLSLSHYSCLSGWCFMVFVSAGCWCSCFVMSVWCLFAFVVAFMYLMLCVSICVFMCGLSYLHWPANSSECRYAHWSVNWNVTSACWSVCITISAFAYVLIACFARSRRSHL